MAGDLGVVTLDELVNNLQKAMTSKTVI
jgi:hypothetical protein